MDNHSEDDLRLIEAGFPCHQVGAETQRERDTGISPPPNRLHVWWARRPLTASRAAILASLLPADADTDRFLRDLGIEIVQVNVKGVWWAIDDVKLKRLEEDKSGQEWYRVDHWTLKWLEKENKQRRKMRDFLHRLQGEHLLRGDDDLFEYWQEEFQAIPKPFPEKEGLLPVRRVPGHPAEFSALMELAKAVGKRIPNLYGYDRAYQSDPPLSTSPVTVLDPTAGGGSIPFESLRLGHQVLANELNPVASVILKATLDYPARYGNKLTSRIEHFGHKLLASLEASLQGVFHVTQPLPASEQKRLEQHLSDYPSLIQDYSSEETTTYLYARQVTCPNCGGDAPLLNSCWLSKQEGDQWGVKIIPAGRERNGTVRFETYRVQRGRGPRGEDPDFSTVSNAVGQCIHCKQAISSEEIKRQARGESSHGEWEDRLYCVVGVRYQPKFDKKGKIYRYKSGQKEGQIRTEKVTFFRPPNERDFEALIEAERRLERRWPEWERAGLIPTESIPEGHKTQEPLRVGMTRWCDMFTPRQLLVHLTLVEELNRLKPQVLSELGEETGKAVVTYLQFAIDKGLDYNSRQTRWEYTRGIVKGTFGRHDYSVKWTFGELNVIGPNSGAAWGLGQVLDAYERIAELVAPLHEELGNSDPPVRLFNHTAAHIPEVSDSSVDLVCMDPPYYNNVQYAELSDYFYVWEKRTLEDLYPELFRRRLTNKRDEAVANPTRDGGSQQAQEAYERMMGEIFAECQRVLKPNGLMTLMFTHKSQEAWEALTKSLIQNGWIISACFPVESEGSYSTHQMDMAAAASAVFLSCRKREATNQKPATWTGFGGSGVRHQVQEAVREGLEEFRALNLNPVDEMVASYGRALRVLSQNWPVLDGDKEVSPLQAMNEASRMVAENQVSRITQDRLQVADLNPEAAMALTIYGIYGLAEFPYDDALNLSRSLRVRLENVARGYEQEGRMIGINDASRGSQRGAEGDEGYFAPLVRSGSKLRLALPGERHPKRLENPQTAWDLLHGLLMAYREGDIPVARAYLQEHAGGRESLVLNLLRVWTAEMGDEELRKEGAAVEFGLADS